MTAALSPRPAPDAGPETAAIVPLDPLWSRLRAEAEAAARAEPALSALFVAGVLQRPSLEASVAHRVAARLHHRDLPSDLVEGAFAEALADEPSLGEAFRADLLAVLERDPVCSRLVEPLLYFKGFHAIQAHRLAHWLWGRGRRDFALLVQSRSSAAFATDLHPAAKLGRGLFLDHATGLVVGATAVIGDDVSMLQDVTLGGTGKERGDRHPKIGRGVLLGAGAKVLGNIEVGCCSRVAAGSVVLADVPPNSTVAGVPARVVGTAGCAEPARSMDQVPAPGSVLGG